jgi:zinc transport system ATP-binding protein
MKNHTEFLLKARNITKNYHRKIVLNHVNLDIAPGSITTIIGPNGGGKTTLLRILIGLTKPSSGTIYRQANLHIGYVPQKLDLNPYLPMQVNDFLRYQTGSTINDTDLTHNIIIEWTHIQSLLHQSLHELSGGEMQRVLLASALIPIPDLLVLDEPIKGLDIKGQENFYQLIEKIRQKYKLATILVSHDLHTVMRTTDHVLCIWKHICCQGSPADVSVHPSYTELFGHDTAHLLGIYRHHHDHNHEEA